MTYFGSAWYPEHWPEDRWARDCELMVAAGFNVVRIAEFAWSSLEPADGAFAMDWLVRAIDCAAAAGMEVVIGTPTAAPPAWLTRAHPDVLPVRSFPSGTIQPHGQRGHYDPTNPIYRRYCRRVIAAMAAACASHPAVIGWQTDNEFWSIAENPGAVEAFRSWCQRRYGSLDAMNAAWSAAYWSQSYGAWSEIDPPLENPNPGLFLAWRRWASDATTAFQQDQIDLLRDMIPEHQWITHNFHPYDDLDRTPIARPLDLLSWDAYVYRNEHDRLDPAFSGRECDRIRDLNGGKRPFWIMETLPGFVNWRNVNRHFEPGESRSMAWHLLAHGADAVLYWQWRSAPGGQEQYHGSLLHQDGEPRPVYHEIAQVGAELQALGPLLDGSSTRPSVALIDRWCDRTALRQQPHHRQYDPATAPDAWYRAVRAQGLDLAVLEAVELADAPPLVIAPQLHLVDDREAAALLAYVEQGGHLILGPRSLMKNEENALRPERQPGPLGAALGASAIEYYALPDEVAVAGDCAGSVACFAEWWQRADETCEQWATFAGHPWLDGQPAVLSRPHGAGRISLCAGLADDALAAAVVGRACALASLSGPIDIPPAVELTTRWTADDQPLYLLINHGTEPVNITLPRLLRNRLGTDQDGQMTIALEAYGVALLSD